MRTILRKNQILSLIVVLFSSLYVYELTSNDIIVPIPLRIIGTVRPDIKTTSVMYIRVDCQT